MQQEHFILVTILVAIGSVVLCFIYLYWHKVLSPVIQISKQLNSNAYKPLPQELLQRTDTIGKLAQGVNRLIDADRSLNVHSQEMESVLDSIETPIAFVGHDLLLHYANSFFMKLLNPGSSLVDKHISDCFDKEQWHFLFSSINDVMSGLTCAEELCIDGISYQCLLIPIQMNYKECSSSEHCFSIILQPIYAIKNTEEEFRNLHEQYIKLKQWCMKEKQEHDAILIELNRKMRSPLNAIQGTVDILANTDLAVKQRRNISSIQRALNILIKTVSHFSEYAAIELGSIDLRPSVVDLYSLMHEALDSSKESAWIKKSKIFLDPSASVSKPLIYTDEAKVSYVFSAIIQTLIDNFPESIFDITSKVVDRNDESQILIQFSLSFAVNQLITKKKISFGSLEEKIFNEYLAQISATFFQKEINDDSAEYILQFNTPIHAIEVFDSSKINAFDDLKILRIHQDPCVLANFQKMLAKSSCTVTTARSFDCALKLIADAKKSGNSFDLLVLNYSKPIASRLRKHKELDSLLKDIPIFMVEDQGISESFDWVSNCSLSAKLGHFFTIVDLYNAIDSLCLQKFSTSEIEISYEEEIKKEEVIESEQFTFPEAKILVAEDELINQEMIQELFNEFDCKVTVAENGRIAFKEFIRAQNDSNPYDLVLMDWQMPLKDGMETTSLIRNYEQQNIPNSATPIVLCTGEFMGSIDKQLSIHGLSDYIQKPICKSQLHDTLLKWIPSSKLQLISAH